MTKLYLNKTSNWGPSFAEDFRATGSKYIKLANGKYSLWSYRQC